MCLQSLLINLMHPCRMNLYISFKKQLHTDMNDVCSLEMKDDIIRSQVVTGDTFEKHDRLSDQCN